MTRQVARVAAEAEERCAQAIRAAIPALGSSAAAKSGRGGGAAARTAALLAARGAARRAATGLARRGVRSALGDVARKHESKLFCGDPVDLATGRMALPQTDLTLPGRLPWCSPATSSPPTAPDAGSAPHGPRPPISDWRSTLKASSSSEKTAPCCPTRPRSRSARLIGRGRPPSTHHRRPRRLHSHRSGDRP